MVTAGNLMAVPVGALLIGPLIELIGVIWTMAIVASIGTIGPLICLAVPVFRQIDHSIEEFQPTG